MKSDDVVQELLVKVEDLCRTPDVQPPAYPYIPLGTKEEGIRVMKSRRFNELRVADLVDTWLKTTPELEVKAIVAESAHEEMIHGQLWAKRIRDLGDNPFEYRPLPA